MSSGYPSIDFLVALSGIIFDAMSNVKTELLCQQSISQIQHFTLKIWLNLENNMPMNIFHLFETKQKGKQIIIEGLQSKFVQVII